MSAFDPHALKIYTDGSALRNPGGPGGFAGIAFFPDDWEKESEIVFQIGYRETTNNRMELRAVIKALTYVSGSRGDKRLTRAIILTDSQYVAENHSYATTWRSNGWHGADGRPIANVDLWKEFIRERAKIRTSCEVIWIEGKSSPPTLAVDKLAKEAAKHPTESDRGFSGGKVGWSVSAKGVAAPYPIKDRSVDIRVYRKQYIQKDKYKISFDANIGGVSSRYYAFADGNIANRMSRGNMYEIILDGGKDFPEISRFSGRS